MKPKKLNDTQKEALNLLANQVVRLFELRKSNEKVASLPGVRVVVLSGEGRGFCAGLDFSSFKGMGDRERKPGAEATVGAATSAELPENHAQRPGMVWKRCPLLRHAESQRSAPPPDAW